MQLQIPCEPCRGTGRQGDARDEFGERETCPTCKGEGALVRCSCGAVVAIAEAGSNGFCAQCPETVARRAAIEKLRATPLAEQLAAMEAAEIRQEQKLLAFADELRGNLDKLERALRGEVSP